MEPTGESRVEATVPTSPSSVIKAAQSYPSGFASQQGLQAFSKERQVWVKV